MASRTEVNSERAELQRLAPPGYCIDELIGRGGMGVVYRGTDLHLERPVAIKLIAGDRASDPSLRLRFEREARLMAAIDHPNVIPIYAAGEDDGRLYLIMRYVAGTDLGSILRTERRLEPRRAARITSQLAAALDAAHAAGLVHRDIKPSNVLLAGDHVYLSDFGITRAVEQATTVTESDEWIGTVDFSSPEHLRAEPTDARSDVYSLGCLLFMALTGSAPFHRKSAAATILAHLSDPPPHPSQVAGVAAAFDEVIATALAKEPRARYPSAGELGRATAAAASDGGDGPGGGAVTTGAGDGSGRDAVAIGAGEGSGRDGVTTSGDDSPTTPRPPLAATQIDVRPRAASAAPTQVDRRRRSEPATRAQRRRSARILTALAISIAVVAGVVVAVLGSGTTPPRPLSSADVEGAVRSFAAAYGHRDVHALAAVLAPDVARVSPTGVQRGRGAVVAEYASQFANRAIDGYVVSGLRVTTGWVGRASARYAVRRAGQSTLGGSVVFGVKRVGGQPLIGLITTQPPG